MRHILTLTRLVKALQYLLIFMTVVCMVVIDNFHHTSAAMKELRAKSSIKPLIGRYSWVDMFYIAQMSILALFYIYGVLEEHVMGILSMPLITMAALVASYFKPSEDITATDATIFLTHMGIGFVLALLLSLKSKDQVL